MESATVHPEDATGVAWVFRALRHRNYRLFFAGQSISLIGTWMQQVAMSWLVYRLTNSAFLLGAVGFSSQIPTSLLTVFAGVVADRFNRHRILVVTQTLAMVQALTLALLVYARAVAVWQIIALSVLLGCVNAFDIPARQAFIVDMIERKEDLGNAIALNSSMFHGARLLGPSLAGVVIAVAGEALCFLLNGLSYVAVVIALLSMKVPGRDGRARQAHPLHTLREGFAYAFGFAPIRWILLLIGLVSFMATPYSVLMPVFAKEILRGDSHTFGFQVGASGLGALAGSMYLASRKSVRGLSRLIPLAAGCFGVGLISFALSRVLWVSLVLLAVAGFGMIVQMASSNTVLQTIVDDDKRGRVMSLYAVAFVGMAPFGSLLAGSLASTIGAPRTVALGGVSCLMGALVFAWRLPAFREAVRPIYTRLGILP